MSLSSIRSKAAALVGLLALATPSTALTEDLLAWRSSETVPDLVDHLDGWLDANTNVPRRDDGVTVRLVDAQTAAFHAQGLAFSGYGTLRGLYDGDETTIWLVYPWDMRNPFDASVLLHELMHHRQATAGHWYCPGAQEPDAYDAQEKWLAELGLDLDYNRIAVVLEAGCTPRDIHPD